MRRHMVGFYQQESYDSNKEHHHENNTNAKPRTFVNSPPTHLRYNIHPTTTRNGTAIKSVGTINPKNVRKRSSPSDSPRPQSALKLLYREKNYDRPRLTLLQPPSSASSSITATTTTMSNNPPPEQFELKLGITEIVGEAGSGKTQIGLGLCVSCASSCLPSSLSSSSTSSSSSFSSSSLTGGSTYPHLPPTGQIPTSTPPPPRRHPTVRNPYASQRRRHGAVVASPPPHQPTTTTTGVAIPSPRRRALYVSLSEGGDKLALHRLSKITTSRHGPAESRTILSSIVIKSVPNKDDFRHLIFVSLPALLRSSSSSEPGGGAGDDDAAPPPFGIVVLDSLGGLFRCAAVDDGDGVAADAAYYAERSCLFFDVAARLKALSETYGIPVVVVNQVSSPGDNNGVNGGAIPALGMSWSNCVNARFLLTRFETTTTMPVVVAAEDGGGDATSRKGEVGRQRVDDGGRRSRFVRHIRVLLSSSMRDDRRVEFRIDATGCRVVADASIN